VKLKAEPFSHSFSPSVQASRMQRSTVSALVTRSPGSYMELHISKLRRRMVLGSELFAGGLEILAC